MELRRSGTARFQSGTGILVGLRFLILNLLPGVVEFLAALVPVFLDLISVDFKLNAGLAITVFDAVDVVPVENPSRDEEDDGTEKEQKDQVSHEALHSATL